jgi:hypothetical protein
MNNEKDLAMEIGDYTVVCGDVSPNSKIGSRSVVISATHENGSVIIDRPMAVGYGAQAGETGIAIGAFAGASNPNPLIQGDYVAGDKVMGDQVIGDKIGTQINHSPNLAQAAADIQSLLQQLSETYNSATPVGQEKISSEAISEIKRNPTLQARIFNALKEGSSTALTEAINHPVAATVISTVKGFLDIK